MLPGRSRASWLLIAEAISLPEDSAGIALDLSILGGDRKAFFGPAAILKFLLDPKESAIQLLAHYGGGSAAEERVENEIAPV